MKKQNTVGLLAVAAVVFVACLGGSYLGIGLSRSHSPGSPDSRAGVTHEELHQALNLTPEQEAALVPLEDKAEKRESALREALSTANAELAQVFVSERSYSPKVEKSVEKIHRAMAELQKATLEHLFEMEEVLTPGQYDKLLRLAGDSLPHSH
jgi:Spy/CpxP family protein refolding chaperone